MNSNDKGGDEMSTKEGDLNEFAFNSKIGPSTADPQISQIYGLGNTGETSYFESKIVSKQMPGTGSSQRQRAMTRSPLSRYRNIPTKNVKFEKFIELIFKSKM